MSEENAANLLKGISVLLRVFLVDETRFPSAEGRMRYNPIDFQTLLYLESHPGCQGADIARALKAAPTTQQSSLDRLIRLGLVEKSDHPSSGRSKAYALTNDGRDLRAAIHRQDIANMKTMLSFLQKDERDEIVRLVEKVAKGLAEIDGKTDIV